jgi:hypothetical protein
MAPKGTLSAYCNRPTKNLQLSPASRDTRIKQSSPNHPNRCSPLARTRCVDSGSALGQSLAGSSNEGSERRRRRNRRTQYGAMHATFPPARSRRHHRYHIHGRQRQHQATSLSSSPSSLASISLPELVLSRARQAHSVVAADHVLG